MKLPSKTLEHRLFKQGYTTIFGVDEVGMGCLAGPVVGCAVRVEPEFYKKAGKELAWLRDSKLLTAAQREVFATALKQHKHFDYQIGYCFPKTIDRLNIFQAARLAMQRAVKRLANPKSEIPISKQIQNQKLKNRNHLKFRASSLEFTKTIVLIDGPHTISRLNLEQRAIVKGDRKVFVIACASILAKVYRDRMMAKYAKKYPGYGFEIHKGYGTKMHRENILMLGPCQLHRRSFYW